MQCWGWLCFQATTLSEQYSSVIGTNCKEIRHWYWHPKYRTLGNTLFLMYQNPNRHVIPSKHCGPVIQYLGCYIYETTRNVGRVRHIGFHKGVMICIHSSPAQVLFSMPVDMPNANTDVSTHGSLSLSLSLTHTHTHTHTPSISHLCSSLTPAWISLLLVQVFPDACDYFSTSLW